MKNRKPMETEKIILDLLQKVEQLATPSSVTKAILAYRVIRNLTPNSPDTAHATALKLGCMAEEIFYLEDEPRFTPDDVIDALCYTEATQSRLSEISGLPMEQFAAIAIRACVEYRVRMEHGTFDDDGVSLRELLEGI